MKTEVSIHRRKFLQSTTLAAVGISTLNMFPLIAEAHRYSDDDINLIRPLEGYSPHIGILVSMLTWNRASVVRAVQGLTQSGLDFLVDDTVLVEIKSVAQLDNNHLAQAINYLEAYGLEIGLLINFGSRSLQFKRVMKPIKSKPEL